MTSAWLFPSKCCSGCCDEKVFVRDCYQKISPEKGHHYFYYYHRKRLGLLLRSRLRNQVLTVGRCTGSLNTTLVSTATSPFHVNCQDSDSLGILGRLREQTSEKVFAGRASQWFPTGTVVRAIPLEKLSLLRGIVPLAERTQPPS